MCRSCKERCETCDDPWSHNSNDRCVECRKKHPTAEERKRDRLLKANDEERKQIVEFFVAMDTEYAAYKEYSLSKGMTWETMKPMKKFLTDKEYAILKARRKDRMTLEQTGRMYGVTRERIRQVETKILRMLIEATDASKLDFEHIYF